LPIENKCPLCYNIAREKKRTEKEKTRKKENEKKRKG